MPSLEFKGKQFIYAHHLTVPYRPLVLDAAKSLNPAEPDDNLIIHGDNLHALKALLPRYAGQVKCIYIDPPYNTGNEGWVYNDKVNSPLMKEWLKEQSPVDGEDLERHDKWLCMMWPRLQLLKELLADDGVIFVSIDDNEQHHLRMLMDEVFNEANFFAVLTRRAMHTVRNSSKDFNLNADYVLAYAKDKLWFGEDQSRYIRYVTDKSTNYPHDDGDERGRYKFDPNKCQKLLRALHNSRSRMARSGKHQQVAILDILKRPSGRWSRDGRIDFSGKEPRAKRYLNEVQEGQPPDAVLAPEVAGFNAHGTSRTA